MVKITPEEVIRRRQLEQASVDELDGIDRAIVGDVARIDIPLRYLKEMRPNPRQRLSWQQLRQPRRGTQG